MYSARRKNGKRLYEYAREGKYVDAEAKTVYIDADLTYYDTCDFDMTVTCTKGTYIRSLCEDIGRSLGCGACMTGLFRKSTGVFNITNSVNLDELKSLSNEEIDKLVIPIDECIPKFGKARCGKKEANLFANGQILRKGKWKKLEEPAEETRTFYVPVAESYSRSYRVYGEDGGFLGIGLVDADLSLKPDKIFL
jgi:tRNA pseudouridine55 synthase